MRNLGAIVAAATLVLTALKQGHTQTWDTFSDTWSAIDGLGRELPSARDCRRPRSDRFVGIFYFLWLEGKSPVYDITKILSQPGAPSWGPPNAFHFWGEPRFGYYRSDDPWVIRRHAQMLGDAGVDVVIFDVTNAFTYDATVLAVCKIFDELRLSGQRVPQITFIAHSRSDQVVNGLYDRFYQKGLYRDLWFRWQGKPLMLASAIGLREEVRDFFALRESWAWTKNQKWFGDGRDKWPWLDHTPQTPGWHDSPDRPEAISVAIAEHPVGNIGRSFHAGKQPPPNKTATEQGLYFAEQWEHALKVDPQFVFVTGWNEWIAQRFLNKGGIKLLGQPLAPGDTYFVDQYSQEFSRDIEPMHGGHGDAYYYQLVSYIRKYKGVRPLPPLKSQPITIDGKFDDWPSVHPEFRDTLHDTVQREHPSWKNEPAFSDKTARNDIACAKVSVTDQNIYFYCRARTTLTPPAADNWMTLLIDADHDWKTGCQGYEYAVLMRTVSERTLSLCQIDKNGQVLGTPVPVDFRYARNELELAVPRAALKLTNAKFNLRFKWLDNVPLSADTDAWLLHGDAAPNGRFAWEVHCE